MISRLLVVILMHRVVMYIMIKCSMISLARPARGLSQILDILVVLRVIRVVQIIREYMFNLNDLTILMISRFGIVLRVILVVQNICEYMFNDHAQKWGADSDTNLIIVPVFRLRLRLRLPGPPVRVLVQNTIDLMYCEYMFNGY
jgi:hypothetical protein